MSSARQMLAEYLRQQASWRALKAEEWPEDARNGRCARGLEDLASYVETHPDDPGLEVIEAWHDDYDTGDFEPGEEGARAVSRFRFDNKDPAESCEDFLKRLGDALLQDRLETTREGPSE